MPVLHCELGGDETAHRLADEAKLPQLERIEQLDVMQHVVVDLVDRGIVGRRAEARMIGDHDAELVAPGRREIEPRHSSGAVQEDERRAAAGLQDHGIDAVDF